MDANEFRRHGHALIDWLADHMEGLNTRPVMAPTRPGEVKAMLPAAAPEAGEPFEAVIADLDRVVTPHLTWWQHPRFFGFFPANALAAGVLGDLVSTGLGVLGLSWQASPALTEVEEVVVDWLRQALGLSDGWFGAIQDTASTSTLLALIAAREAASGHAMQAGGLQQGGPALVVYGGEGAHSSVAKAALLAGFGRDNLRLIPLGADYAMDPAALARAIAEDRAAGRIPCAVVATCGATGTTACDDVAAIAAIAREAGAWLHVDAAMAGSAMILPEMRHLWAGVERADSLVVNAHKWLGVPFDCSLFYVRDEQLLLRVLSTSPSYLRSAADGQVRNLRDTGIALGRRFRALKLWFVLREQGLEALRARLRRDLANAAQLADWARATPHWRVVAPVPLQTVCLRHEPPGLDGPALEEHNRQLAEKVNATGKAYVTGAEVAGQWLVRVSVGALATELDDVRAGWEVLRAEANR
ncbi:MAG: aminotransferase class V-fold PLP-dependent enzyme [Proteobacteria bacterium]|nr:aminotransferase class V-fold PLP-dependent enzyme [Pseudomonadota bacterium]